MNDPTVPWFLKMISLLFVLLSGHLCHREGNFTITNGQKIVHCKKWDMPNEGGAWYSQCDDNNETHTDCEQCHGSDYWYEVK